MSTSNHYRDMIEALGMRAPKNRVINALNRIAAQSDDAKLRGYAARLIKELDAKSTEPTVCPVNRMKSVPTAAIAQTYCEERAYPKSGTTG